MSLPSGRIRCHGCNFEGMIQYRPVILQYRLITGETVDRHRVSGWCMTCVGIRDVEAQLDVNAIRRELNERNLKHLPNNGQEDSDDKAELQQFDALLRLAESRRSPPRCLTCGETSITYLDFDDKGTSSKYVHTCGRRLYQVPVDPDAPRFSRPYEIVLLDAEGRRLRE